ncbi:MAG: recombinase RecT [Phycisphaerae bacterium]|nr:recombinase RecT [Phycisphaerae bacterium]
MTTAPATSDVAAPEAAETRPTAEAEPQSSPAVSVLAVPSSGAIESVRGDMFLDRDVFNQAWRAGQLLSRCSMLPDQFRNKPEDCFVMLQLARRLDCDVFMLAQNCYIVHGRPGFEAKFAIGLVNTKGPFKGPIQWTVERDPKTRRPISCAAYAVHRVTGERCEATVDMSMVDGEGWSKKDGSKWRTMPEQMFKYRSAMFLARLYCPEVLMGMKTADELEDIIDQREFASNAQLPGTGDGTKSSFGFAETAPAPAPAFEDPLGPQADAAATAPDEEPPAEKLTPGERMRRRMAKEREQIDADAKAGQGDLGL